MTKTERNYYIPRNVGPGMAWHLCQGREFTRTHARTHARVTQLVGAHLTETSHVTCVSCLRHAASV